MSASTPTRRSARIKKPNQRYTNDAFEGLEIDTEDPQKGSTGSPAAGAAEDDESGDEEFAGEGDAVGSAEEASSQEDASEGSLIGSDGEEQPRAKRRKSAKQKQTDKRKGSRVPKAPDLSQPKTRGLPTALRTKTEKHHIRQMVGHDPEDLRLYNEGLHRWGPDWPTLPSREMTEDGIGGMSYPPGYGEEERKAESDSAWRWYHEDEGLHVMATWQDMHALTREEADEYYPLRHQYHGVVMGPYGKQRVFQLELGSPMHLSEPWKDVVSSDQEENFDEHDDRRDGWIINCGGLIRCMAWAPNQSGGAQYLAISILNTGPPEAPKRTPFDATPPYQTCIEIWSFAANLESGLGRMDNSKPPRLVHVICCDWGQARRLRWCPVPNHTWEEKECELSEQLIGLLAGVWSDGYARVLDVRIPKVYDPAKVYVQYKGAAFASKPPKSVCSCVTWASDIDLIAGCANGMVAAWDISSAILDLRSAQPPNPLSASSTFSFPSQPPHLHIPLHDGYILDCATVHPLLPHYLSTTSSDGFTRLTSLINPSFDTVVGPRLRLNGNIISVHMLLRGILAPDDQHGVRLMSLRRFWTTIVTAQCPAQVTALASATSHACILLGSADGSTVVTNPLARVGAGIAFSQVQQRWFLHEWRPLERDNEKRQGRDKGKDKEVNREAAVLVEKEGKKKEKEAEAAGNGKEAEDGGREVGVEKEKEKEQENEAEGAERRKEAEKGHGKANPASQMEGIETAHDPHSYEDPPSPTPDSSARSRAAPPRPGLSRISEPFTPALFDPVGEQHEKKARLGAGKGDKVNWTTIYEEESAVTAAEWNPNPVCGGWAAVGMGSGLVRVEDLAIG